MSLKPLSEPGVPFTEAISINPNVTSLFVLPEGAFYTTECLVLDPVTGIPLLPVVDYMFYQQEIGIAKVTAKQVAAIIHIRNPDILNVVVKGRYTHGVTQEQIDNWNNLCILYKDVPKWMNWTGCLDDPLQVHPSVKRTVTNPPMEKRTLSDVEVELNFIADQFENGDTLYTSHIEYWQQQLFLIAENNYRQASTDLNTYINKMRDEVSAKIGDFLFTTGDGEVWANGPKNAYKGVTLEDRGVNPLGSYFFLPEGKAIPSTRTNLFNRVTAEQNIQGLIITNKTNYYTSDVMQITVQISQLTNRVSENAKVQVIDPLDETVLGEFVITDIKQQTYSFQLNLNSVHMEGFSKQLIVRIPEYMWLNPVIVNVLPTIDPAIGYISAELMGLNNIGVADGGGFVNEIKVKFKRVGPLTSPARLYVHLSGDYPQNALKPGYNELQAFDFPIDFVESEEIIAEFIPQGTSTRNYRAEVRVSKVTNPNDLTSIIARNVWYITSVPINPYIAWQFSRMLPNGEFEGINTEAEGNDVYVAGKLSVDRHFYTHIPQLLVTSNGVGSAVEGVDFVIDRNNLIEVDNSTVAYKVTLPFKPEQETQYKFLRVRSINSNEAELWIVDKIGPADIVASWHNSAVLGSPVADWIGEKATVYLHIKAPTLADGTILNLSVDGSVVYQGDVTHPAQTTIFAGVSVVKIDLDAPVAANPVQYLRMLITGPNINYKTLGIMVLDTVKPYYEIRYIVNGLADALTAWPGDIVQCQARCIKSTIANGSALVMLSGSSMSSGPDTDFVLPPGTTSLLKSAMVDFNDWSDLFVNNATVKTPMRLDHLTLTTNIIFPLNQEGIKQGKDTNATLNLRRV